MKKRIWIQRFGMTCRIVSALAVFVLTDRIRPAAAQIPDVPGWRLFWHDEFDGTSLNTANWEALNRPNSFNNEKQFYRLEQVQVAGGHLKITATNEPLADKLYRSGLVTSKSLFGPGRFEARIDLPTSKGMWPAFWLNANQVQWPLGGEIDIMENKGSQPTITSSAFHWQKDPGPCCGAHQFVSQIYQATENGQPVDFTTGFHTYAVEWDTHPTTNAHQLRFYVDGQQFFTVNQDASMSDANFTTAKNIILNLAVGGDFDGDPDGTTVFPQTMLVDYVRVWHRSSGVPGDYNGDEHVDAADYIAWRKSEGRTGIGLPADGSGNGSVGPEDYDVWRHNFASSHAIGAATLAALNVPESPATLAITASLIFVYAERSRLLSAAGDETAAEYLPSRHPPIEH